MAFKFPFDPAEMMKMFDPQQMSKMFSPDQFQSAFAPLASKGLDVQSLMEANKRNMEAVMAANKAAMEANKSVYEKQMQIFEAMTETAQKQAQSLSSTSPQDFAKKQAEIYGAAFEKSLTLMTELAETTRKANEQAFANLQQQIDTAMNDLKKM